MLTVNKMYNKFKKLGSETLLIRKCQKETNESKIQLLSIRNRTVMEMVSFLTFVAIFLFFV